MPVPEKQRRFIECYQGSCKGRYHLAYLAILGIAGGEQLQKEAVSKFGRDVYLPEQMYPMTEAVNIIHFGMTHGVPAERMGRMVAQSYKRAMPAMFENMTHDKAIDLLLLAYSSETDVSNVLKLEHRQPGRVLLSRTNSPQPCEYMLGVIRGGFDLGNLKANVREIKCQWKADDPHCLYEITW